MKNFPLPFGAWLLMLLTLAGVSQAQTVDGKLVTSVIHSVSIHADGTLWTWGGNFDGQLGDGSTAAHAQPVQVLLPNTTATDPANARWAQVAAGAGHTLALTTDGQLYAWGANSEGQLGLKSFTRQLQPTLVPLPAEAAGTRWAQVAAGTSHTLALTADGRLYSWGHNVFGQLGDGTIFTRPQAAAAVVLPAGAGAITRIVAGNAHSLALTADGKLFGWGLNTEGQLGDGSTMQHPRPVAVALPRRSTATGWAQVAAGASHTLALTTDGQLYGWGCNKAGQLARLNGTSFSQAVAIGLPAKAQAGTWARIAAGPAHSLAIMADGRRYTWGTPEGKPLGSRLNGQLSYESTVSASAGE
jgi:alpha-tubulin suppressor-like RCC1 family protein